MNNIKETSPSDHRLGDLFFITTPLLFEIRHTKLKLER